MGLPPWYEVESSDQFSALDDTQKNQTRNDYFDSVISENEDLRSRSPEEIEGVRARWLEKVTPAPAEHTFLGNIKDIGVESFRKVGDSVRVADDIITGNFDKNTAGIISGSIARGKKQFEPEELKSSKKMMAGVSKDWEEAKGWKEGLSVTADAIGKTAKEVVTNPKGVAYLAAESVGTIAPTIGGQVTGAYLGAAASGATPNIWLKAFGAAVGAGLGTMTAEMEPKFTEILQEELSSRGLDPTEKNIQTLISDKSFTKDALKRARLKALGTAATDAVFAGVAGRGASAPLRAAEKQAAKTLGEAATALSVALETNKILSARLFGDRVKTGAKVFGTELVSEPVSEAAGQLLADQQIDMGDLVGETLGGFGTSAATAPVDAYTFGSTLKRDATINSGETAPEQQFDEAGVPIETQVQTQDITQDQTQQSEAPQTESEPEPQVTMVEAEQIVDKLNSDDIAPDDESIAPQLMAILDSEITDEDVKVALEKSGVLAKFGVPTRMERVATATQEELLNPESPIGETVAPEQASREVMEATTSAIQRAAPQRASLSSSEIKSVIAAIKKDPEAGYSTDGMNQTQKASMEAFAGAVQRGSKKAVARLEKRAIKRAEAQNIANESKFVSEAIGQETASQSYESGENVTVPDSGNTQVAASHQAMDKMISEVEGGEVSKSFQDKDGTTTPASSSYPYWYKQKNVRKYNKENGTRVSLRKNTFRKLIEKARSGKKLTPLQQQNYDYLKSVAEDYVGNDPEIVASREYSELEKEGFELEAPKDVTVGSLKPGDEIVIEKGGIPDKLTHMGYDKDGNALLQDGELIKADPFEQVEVISSKIKGDSANKDKVDAMVAQITESATAEDVANLQKEMPGFLVKNKDFEPYSDIILGALERRGEVLGKEVEGKKAQDTSKKGDIAKQTESEKNEEKVLDGSSTQADDSGKGKASPEVAKSDKAAGVVVKKTTTKPVEDNKAGNINDKTPKGAIKAEPSQSDESAISGEAKDKETQDSSFDPLALLNGELLSKYEQRQRERKTKAKTEPKVTRADREKDAVKGAPKEPSPDASSEEWDAYDKAVDEFFGEVKFQKGKSAKLEAKAKAKTKTKKPNKLKKGTEADIVSELEEADISKRMQATMEKRGLFEIVDAKSAMEMIDRFNGKEKGATETRRDKDGRIQGFTMPNGKIFLVQGNIKKGDVYSVLMHEAGHSFLPSVLKGKQWNRLVKSFKNHSTRQTKTGEAIRAAQKRVPKNTDANLVDEETIMYFLTETANEKLSLYKRIMAHIRNALVRMGFPASILQPNDIRVMVEGFLAKAGGTRQRFSTGEDIKFSRIPMMPQQFLDATDKITNTEAFKKWFGESKITSNGRPHVLYHGTSDPKFLQDKDYPWVFDKDAPVRSGSSPLAGLGIFLGNDQIASVHTGGTTGAAIHPFFVRVENPLVITSAELEAKVNNAAAAKVFRKRQQELNGHDGIIIKDRGHVIAFEANQLKSVSKNSGAFSNENPDVRYSVEEAHREMSNTVELNATNPITGEKSKTNAADGEKLIRELLRKLKITSAPAAAKKFSTEEADKAVKAFRDAVASVTDPAMSIADKQAMAAKFATKIPLAARGKLLRMLAKISKLKKEETKRRALINFWQTAEKTVAMYLQSTMRKKMVSLSKAPKLAKDKIKRGKGDDFMRGLDHIRDILENVKTEDSLNAAILEVEQRIARREKILANDKLSKTKRLQIEEKVADDYSRRHLLNVYGGLNPSKNTGSQFEETLSALNHLKDFIKTKSSVWKKQQAAKRDADIIEQNKAIRDITGEENPKLDNQQQAKERKRRADSFVGRMKNVYRVMQNSIQSWELLLADFARDAGGMESGLVKKYSNIIHYATRNEEGMNEKVLEGLRTDAKRILGVSSDRALGKKFTHMSEEVAGAVNLYGKDGVKTESLTVSRAEAGYIYQVSRNITDKAVSDTFAKMGITEKTLTEIKEFMGEDVQAWADYLVDDFYQEFHFDINKVYRIIEGVDLTSTKYYAPYVREYPGREIEKGIESFLGYSQGGSARKGSHKERVYNTTFFKWADMNSVLMDHVADMNHYKAWALPTREINATFNDKTVRKFIEQKNGVTGVKALDAFQKHFMKTVEERKFGNYRALDNARSNLTKALIGANPVVFLKQLASIPAYAADIPTWAWAKYTAEAAMNPVGAKRLLTEKSVMLRARYRKGFERDIAAAKRKTGGQRLSGAMDMSDAMMSLVQLGDKMAIVGGGYAVYAYHFDKARKEKKTVEQADEIAILEFEKSTERAQQSSNIKDLGWMLRGDSVMKLFTMFMTSPASYSRQMFQSVREISRTGQRMQGAKRAFIYGILLPSLFTAVADAMLVFDGDDEDKERLKKNQWKALTLAGFNGLPIVRTLAEGVWNSVDGNGFYGAQITPMLEIMDKTYDVASDTTKYLKGGTSRISEEEYRDRALMNTLHLFGFVKGIPTKSGERFYRGWLGNESEHAIRSRIGYTSYALGE